MTLGELIVKVNYALRSLDDDPPTEGTEEYTYWLSLYNSKKNELYEDVTKNWASAYSVESLGLVTVDSTPSFNLGAEFLAAANQAYILKLDGNKTYIPLIKPNEAETKSGMYIAGYNPQVAYLTGAVTADQDIVGGTLYLPGYFLPADLTTETDDINVPDPNWAVAAVAAEVAFADLSYEDRSEALNSKANMLYNLMVKKNRRGTYGEPRITPTRVHRIRGTEVN